MSGLLITLKNPDREIHWRILTPDDGEATKELLYEHFIKHEPICVTLGLTRKNGIETLAHKVLGCLERGQSICAYDSSNSNKICGVRLAEGPCSAQRILKKLNNREEARPVKLTQVYMFFEHLSHGPDKALDTAAGDLTYMQGLLLSVHQDYFQLGLGSALCKKSLEQAKEAGCQLFFTLCTSFYTAKIFHKLGAKCLREVKYCDYVDSRTGEKIFSNCPKPHFSAKLVSVQL